MTQEHQPPFPVLLVEDDYISRMMTAKVLTRSGYAVTAVETGRQALALLREQYFPIVLTDWKMPEMDGIRLCRAIRARQSPAYVFIVFLTTNDAIDQIADGLAAGANDYLTKPFDPVELIARLRAGQRILGLEQSLRQVNARLARDIEEKNRLLKEQALSIDLARKIMGLVNPVPERHTDLPGGLSLFVDGFSVPCHAEGGDHFFVRHLLTGDNGGKTVISLKDQSGHEVGCVLRSMYTDLLHNALLFPGRDLDLEGALERLNNVICREDVFGKTDYFTAVTTELDHQTRRMRYVSAGHPPFLLIRDQTVALLPAPGAPGSNLPAGFQENLTFTAGSCDLREGDRLIFYTDGLTEMPREQGNPVIRAEQLRSLTAEILSSRPDMPVSEIVDEIVRRVSEMSGTKLIPSDHSGGPVNTSGDDVTLLGVELESRRFSHRMIFHPENTDMLASQVMAVYKQLAAEWEKRKYVSGFRLRLVLEEAMRNAWHHGNRRNPEKAVTVQWRFGNDCRIDILDEGTGFDADREYDPALPEHRLRSSGRGIFLIRRIADAAHWRDGGRHLTVRFQKTPVPPDQKPSERTAGKPFSLWET